MAGDARVEVDGTVRLADLNGALKLLADADHLRTQAALLLGGLDGSGLSEWLGYVSFDRLLAHRSGSGNQEAARFMTVARHLDRFGSTAEALEVGRIGWPQAEVLARTARGFADRYETDEAELLALASERSVEELERACRLWRARADAEAAAVDAEYRHRSRGLWMQFAFDGSCQGQFRLDADSAEIVAQALDTPPDPFTSLAEPRTPAQRRADALVEVCAGSGGTPPEGGVRAAVDVVIDLSTLAGVDGPIDQLRAELNHGAPITGPGLDRLLCDASFRALVTEGPDVVLRYNRATPDIPPGLRRAVRVRDRHCQFDGCDRPWTWCDLHHLVPRNRGGPTTIENLTLVCRHHHTLIHEGGWQLERGPDGAVTTTMP